MTTAESTLRIRLLMVGPRLPETRTLDALLTQQQVIVVVGHVIELARAVEAVGLLRPDVILLHTLGLDFAIEAIGVMLARFPNARLLLVPDASGADGAAQMLEHGASGLLLPRDVHAQGLRAIHAVHAGEIWGSRALLSRIVQDSIKQTTRIHAQKKSSLSLTERESEVVSLLRGGSSNKEIAAQLNISDKTVKTHLQNIFGKMQIHRRQQILPALLLS